MLRFAFVRRQLYPTHTPNKLEYLPGKITSHWCKELKNAQKRVLTFTIIAHIDFLASLAIYTTLATSSKPWRGYSI
jgi:hypothetical protein